MEPQKGGESDLVDGNGEKGHVWLPNVFFNPFSLVLLALLVSVPAILLNQIPDNDCAARYAPMAEAFAKGDWAFAFHPIIPPLFPVLAGVVAWFSGISGFMAAKVASTLLFALGVLPLYGVFKLLFDRRAAFLGCILYIFCPPLIKLSGEGLRDPGKGLFLALGAYGAVLLIKGSPWRGALACGIGAAGLALTRGDSLILALLCLLMLLCAELTVLVRSKSPPLPKATVLATIVFLLVSSPWIAYEKAMTGYPVMELRQAKMLERHLFKARAGVQPVQPQSALQAGQDKALLVDFDDGTTPSFTVKKFLYSFLNGILPPYLLLAIFVIVLRLKCRIFSLGELVLLVALAGNAALVVLQIFISSGILYVSQRYIVVATPLCFGWTALALLWAADKAVKWRAKVAYLLPAIVICAALCLATWGWTRFMPHGSKARAKAGTNDETLLCAEWLKDNASLASELPNRCWRMESYTPGLRPVVADINPKIPGIAGLGFTDLEDCNGDLLSFCKDRNVAFLILRPQMKERAALIAGCQEFKLLKDFREDGSGFAVWGFTEHLKKGEAAEK